MRNKVRWNVEVMQTKTRKDLSRKSTEGNPKVPLWPRALPMQEKNYRQLALHSQSCRVITGSGSALEIFSLASPEASICAPPCRSKGRG